MRRRAIFGLMVVVSLHAADFQNGQAARAVIGQPGFSTHEAGVSATALALGSNRLYAADANRVLTFDLARIPGAKEDMTTFHSGACSLCGFTPLTVTPQAVISGIAGFSTFGRTVVAADPAHHHVLIWRDSSRSQAGPDVVLGKYDASAGVSATTLVNPLSVAFDGKRIFVGDTALHRILIWNSIPVSADQPADTVLGQPDFASSSLEDGPRPDTVRFPAALASDGTNLYVADSLDHRILVFTPGDTFLAGGALVNSATLSAGPIAPGTLVTINGVGLSYRSESSQDDGDGRLPSKLGGVELVVNGSAVPLLSVSPSEIQAQLPYGIDDSSASLYIRTERPDGSVAVSDSVAVGLASATPGLFAFTGGAEPRIGILVHSAAGDSGAGAPVTAESPAAPGEVLTIWATGLGTVSDPETTAVEGVPFAGREAPVVVPVTASLNGRSAQVVSATLTQGAIGIYEVRILLPADLQTDSKAQLYISQSGIRSNTVSLPVESANQ